LAKIQARVAGNIHAKMVLASAYMEFFPGKPEVMRVLLMSIRDDVYVIP
jgi:hypothetical protein